jgi:tetratricopeptide (TPR) repeat protein
VVTAADRPRVLSAARRHAKQGHLDRAIAEYRKLVEADPTDVRTWLNIGDLFTRMGETREAVDSYGQAARHYEAEADHGKALAVYKTMLRLDPSRLDVQERLARTFADAHLITDALSAFEQAARAHAQAGDLDAALRVLEEMVEVDPRNVPTRIKYAEGLSRAGRQKEAAEQFAEGAALLEEADRMDDYIRVAERLLYHQQTDTSLARKLSALYLERGDAQRALAKLQLCFKADPKDIGTLELLAEAFLQLGQRPKAVSVYKEVARIHGEAKRHEARARVFKRIVELDPADPEARRALASYAPSGGQVRPEAPASAVITPPEDDFDDIELIEDDEDEEFDDGAVVYVEGEDPEAGPEGASDQPSVPPDIQREAQIARLLTECDVFHRYGLKEKVLEQLRAVLTLDPEHVEARERLSERLLEAGQVETAIGELLTLARQLVGADGARARLYLRRILDLDASHAEALEGLAAMGAGRVSEEPEASAGGDGGGTGAPTARPRLRGPEAIVDRTDLSVASGAFGIVPSAPASVLEKSAPPPPSAEAEAHPPSAVSTAPQRDPLAPMTPEEFDQVPLRPSEPGRLAAPPKPPGEVEELLEEANFYMAQGLFGEAQQTLVEALERFPEHPLVLDKLEEIRELAARAAARLPKPTPPVDQSFELAERLAREFDGLADASAEGSDVLDVDAVFEQFKRGVEEQVAPDDTATHFDLGIAYKEMGLLDDAIAEFSNCLSNPARVCITETMIGLCHLEKGEIASGIRHFEKGLDAEQRTEREELGLFYELGQAYELLDEPREALRYYQKVQQQEPTFRGLAERIAAMEKRLDAMAPPDPAPSMEQDEIDKLFDDLLGDD